MDPTADPALRTLVRELDAADFSPDELKSVIPFLFFSARGAGEPSAAVRKHVDDFCREAGIDAAQPAQAIEAAILAHFRARPPSPRVLALVRQVLGDAQHEEQGQAGAASAAALGATRDLRPLADRGNDGFRLGALGTHGMQQVLDLKREPADVPVGKPGDKPPFSENP